MSVFPTRAVEDPRDLLARDPEVSCDIAVQTCLPSLAADFCDLFWGEYSSRIVSVTYAEPPCSPFAMHVKQIFGLGAEKQVVGPHAPWYITGVANLQPSRNRTVLQFPTKAMRSGVTTVYPERAVTVLSGALPKPTVLASLHPSPKAHFRYDHGAYCREEN